MKRVIFFFLICFILLTNVASAQIINGDFETGDLTGWTVDYGNVQIANATGEYGDYKCALYGGEYWVNRAYIIGDNFTPLGYNFLSLDLFTTYSNSQLYVKVYDYNTSSYMYSHDFVYTSGWQDIEINMSAYQNHNLRIHVYCHVTVYLDNVELTGYITPPPPQITTIQTRITKETFPQTGIVINDADSTGGFPNTNGYVTLTPTNNSEKIYPITLTGGDLIDGFELQITATSSEVIATPITVNNLGADRTYNIYLDGQFIEKIGEVTTYQYNMTSFSTHTLKVEHDYYVPPGDEEGGGSGPVPPPDEDITPPDEDEIIIEDDIIEIGELILTKDEFDLLTIEQIEASNVSQETKDKLIAIKSINVNWWLFILVISLTGLIVEGSHKKGHESIIIISFIGVIISAYKLGYF